MLLKRRDAGAVGARALPRPGAADDCVRAMIAGALEHLSGAPDTVFVSAAQESFETLHRHCLTAERAGLLGELRPELAGGGPPARRTSMRAWLEG